MASGNIERLVTGVKGLDNMIGGGIPMKNQVIFAGGPGSGKTLLCFETIYRCAKAGIPSAFISFEEQSQFLIRNAKSAFKSFSDIDSLIESGKLVVSGDELASRMEDTTSTAQTYSFGNAISYIEEIVSQNKAKVIAIDSITLFKLILSGESFAYRKSIASLITNLRRLDVTSLITVETPYIEKAGIRYTPEFFLFDGVVSLYQSGADDRRNFNLEILKMRGTEHSLYFAPYSITANGFDIQSVE